MEDILQREEELLKIAGLSDAERLHYLEDAIIRMIDQSSRVQKTLDETKHLELLHWLSSSPFTRHHETLSETRMPNSATWVLDHPEFRDWKNSSTSSILLLHGIPGSGKSNICSAVVDSFLAQQAGNPLAAPVAYFYCDDCEFEPERAEAANVMRSILRQLTITTSRQPAVRDMILSKFDQRLSQSKVDGMDMPRLSTKDCVKLVLDVTAVDPITIVVDALDTVNERDRPELVNALVDIVARASSVVKVFLTSRKNSHVFSLLQDGEIQAHSSVTGQTVQVSFKNIEVNPDDSLKDMKAYVKLAIAQAVNDRRLLKEDPSPELSDRLAKQLVLGAGEMFQWVNVQIEYLCRLKTEEDIMTALDGGTMATLDDMYSLILEQIFRGGGTSRQIAVQAFSWLLYMKEALPVDVFLAAIFASETITEPTKSREQLLTICSHLLLFDSRCNTFRFCHQSVQEFLRKQDHFTPATAQRVLSVRCLGICMDGPPINGMPSDNASTLYQYAALY